MQTNSTAYMEGKNIGIPDAAAKTHLEYFLQQEQEKPAAVFMRQPYGNTWKELNWKQAGDEARRIATYISSLNLPAGSNIAILSKNCYHWILADLAIMMTGHVSTPFFPNLVPAELSQLLSRSEAKVLFIGKLDTPVWDKLKDVIPAGTEVIRFPFYEGNGNVQTGKAWEDILASYAPLQQVHLPKLNDLWTILFTSGTTGAPKGVMLTYKAPASLLNMEKQHNQIGIFHQKEFQFFSYLPLNHIAERMIVETASFFTGGTISFAESLEKFPANLQSVQPTLFMSVPRIYTKFQMAILDKLGSKLNLLLSIPIVSGYIQNKIKKALGFSRCKVILTGAAPTPQTLKDWYLKLGIELREVYGMTENSGGCTLMPLAETRSGVVGKILPEAEVRIDETTGEVLMRAPWIMTGYYRDNGKTDAVLKDGWLYTGDKGEVQDGYLKLTGRISDTFKTAKGKFISPAPMEWFFAKSIFIEQVCVVGLAAPYPLILIVLSEVGRHEEQEKVWDNLIAIKNELNATLPSYSRISKIVLIKEEWSTDNGVLTPTLKIKRNVIDHKYAGYYEQWSITQQDIIQF
jgi:long-chain acyl-CoA synthetase